MIYVFLGNLFANDCIGVKKKVFAQLEVFHKSFGQTYCTSYSGQMMYLLSDGKVLEKNVAITKKECYACLLKWIKEYGIKKAYVRYMLSDKWFIDFIKILKKDDIKFVLEFPTVPYEGELSNKRLEIVDRHYREQLSDYVGKCTTYSSMDSVFGIPCITLMNGIDLRKHPVHKRRKSDDKIILIAVASMWKWHGYERIIKGMADYYDGKWDKKVIFRLVGDGVEKGNYRRLVEKYNLQKYVEILGYMEGEALNEQYNEADIAVGSLALYKSKIEYASPIKIREYCARGIPFIYGYMDIGFSGEENYLLRVSNDDSPIDIGKVVQFYNKIQQHNGYVEEMRKYAVDTCTWDNILKPVIDYYQV